MSKTITLRIPTFRLPRLPRFGRKTDALLLILFAAFLLRFSLSWHPGYGFDTGVYMGWARSAVELGVAESYTQQVGGNMLPDYPPFSILMLAGFGHIYHWMIDDVFDVYAKKYLMFIKVPGMMSDVLIALVLFAVVSRFWSRRHGLVAAAIYSFHPTAIFNSAVWGQTDCIYSLLLLCAIGAWSCGRKNLAAIALALSVLTKLQGILLFPLFFFLVYKDLRTLLRFSLIGMATWLVVLIPFMLGGVVEKVLNVYVHNIGQYGNVAIGAYNFWWALMTDSAWRTDSAALVFDFVSYDIAGITIFGCFYLIILFIFRNALGLNIFSKKNLPTIPSKAFTEALFFCSTLLAGAFFIFLPQMHERYLFPYIVFGVPLVFISKRIAWIYWTACICFWFNLMGIMPFTPIDKALFAQFEAFDGFIASTQVIMFFLLLGEAWNRYGKKVAS